MRFSAARHISRVNCDDIFVGRPTQPEDEGCRASLEFCSNYLFDSDTVTPIANSDLLHVVVDSPFNACVITPVFFHVSVERKNMFLMFFFTRKLMPFKNKLCDL